MFLVLEANKFISHEDGNTAYTRGDSYVALLLGAELSLVLPDRASVVGRALDEVVPTIARVYAHGLRHCGRKL